MTDSPIVSLEALVTQVRIAHATATVTVAEAIAKASPDTAEAEALRTRARHALTAMEARLANARADVDAEALHVRRRRVDAVAGLVRAQLAVGPATEREILSATRVRRDVVRDAMRVLLVRSEVARTPRGYCLAPAFAV